MGLNLIPIILFILYNISLCMCVKRIHPVKSQELNITDYFISKIPDLNPDQGKQVLFDKTYAIFCELFSFREALGDNPDLLTNHPDLFRYHDVPKNLIEVIKGNLNSQGQFLLYPRKSSFFMKLDNYPLLEDYLTKIGTLKASTDYVKSFVSLQRTEKDKYSEWHEFIALIWDFDEILFTKNCFIRFIYKIEYVFLNDQHHLSKVRSHAPIILPEILGAKIAQKIEYYNYFDYKTSLPTSTTPIPTIKISKKGSNYCNGKKHFILRQDQLRAMSSTPSPSNSSALLLCTDESSSPNIDLPPAELEVPPSMGAFVCGANDSPGNRFKRQIPKLIENPLLQILTYNTFGRNVLNKEIYDKLLREFESSKDKANIDFISYLEKSIKSGNSQTINKYLQQICKGELSQSSDRSGENVDSSFSRVSEEAKFFTEMLNAFINKNCD